MSKKIYIHIGRHRCATTALQNFLNKNRVLLCDNGFVYPDFNSFASHPLAWSLDFGDKKIKDNFFNNKSEIKGAVFDTMAEDLKRSENVVLSSEVFAETPNNDPIEAFARQLSGHTANIIVYLRRQDHLIESVYKHWVMFQGYKKGICDLIPIMNLNHYALLDRWANVFGKRSLIVKAYEEKQFLDKNIFSDFLNILGLKFTSDYVLPEHKESNISYNNKTIALFLFLNKRCPVNQVRKLRSVISQIDEVKTTRSSDTSLLSPSKRIEILKKYETSNQQVAREYLNRSDGRLFYEPRPGPTEEWKPSENPSLDTALTLLMKVLAKLP